MYANPLETVVFTMLALSLYNIAHPSILTGKGNLTKGNSQYERFNKIFNEVVQTHRYEFECIGISVEYFRTHSIIKGAAIFVATGCTLSPHMASICLCAN